MVLSSDLWVQSLLLISLGRSPRQIVPPSSSQEQNTTQKPLYLRRVNPFAYVPDPSLLTTRSVSSNIVTSNVSIADLCREQPFWMSHLHPTFRQHLEPLGNGVVVNALPVRLSFFLYGIACGRRSAEYSWEIDGPWQETPVQTIASSSPKKLTFLYIGMFPHLSVQDDQGLRVATIYENISLTLKQAYTLSL